MAKLDTKKFLGGLPDPARYPGVRDCPPGYKDWMAFYDAQDKKLEELIAISDKIDYTNPKASLKGALVGFGVGDGTAWYVVTKDRPLTLANIPFGDAWQAPWVTINGVTADWIRQHNNPNRKFRF